MPLLKSEWFGTHNHAYFCDQKENDIDEQMKQNHFIHGAKQNQFHILHTIMAENKLIFMNRWHKLGGDSDTWMNPIWWAFGRRGTRWEETKWLEN